MYTTRSDTEQRVHDVPLQWDTATLSTVDAESATGDVSTYSIGREWFAPKPVSSSDSSSYRPLPPLSQHHPVQSSTPTNHNAKYDAAPNVRMTHSSTGIIRRPDLAQTTRASNGMMRAPNFASLASVPNGMIRMPNPASFGSVPNSMFRPPNLTQTVYDALHSSQPVQQPALSWHEHVTSAPTLTAVHSQLIWHIPQQLQINSDRADVIADFNGAQRGAAASGESHWTAGAAPCRAMMCPAPGCQSAFSTLPELLQHFAAFERRVCLQFIDWLIMRRAMTPYDHNLVVSSLQSRPQSMPWQQIAHPTLLCRVCWHTFHSAEQNLSHFDEHLSEYRDYFRVWSQLFARRLMPRGDEQRAEAHFELLCQRGYADIINDFTYSPATTFATASVSSRPVEAGVVDVSVSSHSGAAVCLQGQPMQGVVDLSLNTRRSDTAEFMTNQAQSTEHPH